MPGTPPGGITRFQCAHSSRRQISPSRPVATRRSYRRLRSCNISTRVIRPEKITGSLKNFATRKYTLKKWKVKINPAASNASSLWTTKATLMIHPGKMQVAPTGNHQIKPLNPMVATPQRTAK